MSQTISSNKKSSLLFCHSANIELNPLLVDRGLFIITIPAASYDTNKPDEYGAEENVLDFSSTMSADLNKFYSNTIQAPLFEEDDPYEGESMANDLQERDTHYASSIVFGVGDTVELSVNNSTSIGDSVSYIFMSSGPQNVIYPVLSRGIDVDFNTIVSGSLNASSNALTGDLWSINTWDGFSFSLPEDEFRFQEMVNSMEFVAADTSDGEYEDIGSVEMLGASSDVPSGSSGGATGTFISVLTLPGGITVRTHL